MWPLMVYFREYFNSLTVEKGLRGHIKAIIEELLIPEKDVEEKVLEVVKSTRLCV